MSFKWAPLVGLVVFAVFLGIYLLLSLIPGDLLYMAFLVVTILVSGWVLGYVVIDIYNQWRDL
ncbi:MAG TPA: hypothetical protein VI911_12160 [Patescibacteria group bacterium]|nr:hypothetical protein [Patescibacteria group bacterium]